MPIRPQGLGRSVNRRQRLKWNKRINPPHPLSQYASWRMRQKRLKLKITQIEMAAAMGLYLSHYKSLEYGVCAMSMDKIWNASRIFNCHYLELLDGFVPPQELMQKKWGKKLAVNDPVAMGSDPMAPQFPSSSSQSSGSGGAVGGSVGGSNDGPSISTERS